MNINANRSKGEVLSSAIALTDQLYEQSYTLKEERRILLICVGSLLTALHLLSYQCKQPELRVFSEPFHSQPKHCLRAFPRLWEVEN